MNVVQHIGIWFWLQRTGFKFTLSLIKICVNIVRSFVVRVILFIYKRQLLQCRASCPRNELNSSNNCDLFRLSDIIRFWRILFHSFTMLYSFKSTNFRTLIRFANCTLPENTICPLPSHISSDAATNLNLYTTMQLTSKISLTIISI